MKNYIIYLLFLGVTTFAFGQKKTVDKAKDTVKTEVVEIETSYNPKIADANKIHKNPSIEILEKSKKQKLIYNISSMPVASTFIPKSGVIKGIDVGVKEKLYPNYVAFGLGNYNSPYAEAYFMHHLRFDNAFGLHLKYDASFENVENTLLNSTFSNFYANAFYSQKERFYTWKMGVNAIKNTYNWYGLPNTTPFSQNVLNQIDEKQTYTGFALNGSIDFEDSILNNVGTKIKYFTDDFDSKEIVINMDANANLPIKFINPKLNDLQFTFGLEYVNGGFMQSYANQNPLDYSFFTVKLHPTYQLNLSAFNLQIGGKFFTAFDIENSLTYFLLYPDFKLQIPFVKDIANIYAGFTGDLQTNTYQEFTALNPFVSPTLFMTQTNIRTNIFAGLQYLLAQDLGFNISVSRKDEEDKPLFINHNSKSDGTNTTVNSIPLKGYEFGNSFNVTYDDVVTTSITAELDYDVSKKINMIGSLTYHHFQTTFAQQAWNLPKLEAQVLGSYQNEKWYANAAVYFIGDRFDATYNNTHPSSITGKKIVSSYIDANLNGGYHINKQFTAFARLNNILNANYNQFVNFDVQGFQALLGISYKFDL